MRRYEARNVSSWKDHPGHVACEIAPAGSPEGSPSVAVASAPIDLLTELVNAPGQLATLERLGVRQPCGHELEHFFLIPPNGSGCRECIRQLVEDALGPETSAQEASREILANSEYLARHEQLGADAAAVVHPAPRLEDQQLAFLAGHGIHGCLDVVFTPCMADGPEPEGLRFVELEAPPGQAVVVGEWITGENGYQILRLSVEDLVRIDPVPRPSPAVCRAMSKFWANLAARQEREAAGGAS